MLKNPQTWWEQEVDASILLLNQGFLEAEQKNDEFKSLFVMARQWLADAEIDATTVEAADAQLQAQVKLHNDEKKVFERIFERDAERAFVSPKNREIMMHILTILKRDHLAGEYHQGAGLICAFLLLTLSPSEVLALLAKISSASKYLPDYFKAASVACATDGYLWKDLVEERFPDVGAKINSNFILPETFVQKWFCALCVHVLPFSALFKFFSLFFRDGHAFLFRFGLAHVSQFRDPLLACTSQAQIYAILRMDQQAASVVTPEACIAVVEAANTVVVDDASTDYAALRQAAFEKHLKQRLESAARSHAELDQEKDSAPVIACGFCEAEQADYWCRDCERGICDDCRDIEPSPAPHVEEEHNVVDAEDKDNPDDE
jgi:hypothetical protein